MKRKAASASQIRPYCWSLGSAFLWINLVVLILLCHLSNERVNARVLLVRRRDGENVEGLNDNDMLQKPGHTHNDQLAFDDKMSDFDRITLHKQELVDGAYTRDKRGAFALDRRRNNDFRGVKHVQRIPNSNGNTNKNRPAPEPEESSDETFESLEANREAFLDILAENAKHRHRKRPGKKHGSKMHLKYDEKLQQWTLTEEQSEEWVI